MLQAILLFTFWVSIILILYCYIGFPFLLAIRGLFFPKPMKLQPTYSPQVSVIIAAYNEVDNIIKKLNSVLASNYNLSQLEIIVASDGSTDGTNDLVASFKESGVRLLDLPRQGKNSVINQAVATASGEILIFTDADSILLPDSVRNLVAPFADPEIGGVGGDYRHASKNVKQEGERAYWNYDRRLKQLQSAGGSVSGASGALFAIRRSLFKPVPDGVTDDFYIVMQVISSHYRLVFEPTAIALGPVASSAQAEFNRKVRIITRGFRGVWLLRHLLNPFLYGSFAFQLFTHKLLRRLITIPLILLAISAPFLWKLGLFYRIATIVQLAFHLTAFLGLVLRNTQLGQSKVISLPFHFDMIYYASLIGLINALRGKQYAKWGPERSAGSSL
jgi:cellulose synthase/poly-beta-1,6-N-acetylglucosamine synthase-like glycosyltransferase